MTVHLFPSQDTRDPRFDPRIGDVLQVGRHKRTIAGWSKHSWTEDWKPPAVVEIIRYMTPRASGVMPWAGWLAWARKAEVLHVATDPFLEPTFAERSVGVGRVECEGKARVLFFPWGRAVVEGARVDLQGHDGEYIIGMTWSRRHQSWTPYEIVLMHASYMAGWDRRPGKPTLELVANEVPEDDDAQP